MLLGMCQTIHAQEVVQDKIAKQHRVIEAPKPIYGTTNRTCVEPKLNEHDRLTKVAEVTFLDAAPSRRYNR